MSDISCRIFYFPHMHTSSVLRTGSLTILPPLFSDPGRNRGATLLAIRMTASTECVACVEKHNEHKSKTRQKVESRRNGKNLITHPKTIQPHVSRPLQQLSQPIQDSLRIIRGLPSPLR